MNEIVLQQQLTPMQGKEINPLIQNMMLFMVENASVSKVEQSKYLKKLWFAYENGFNLSTAFTGGLFLANGDKVEVEAKPLKHRIANDPNYHLKVVTQNAKECTMQMWRKASDLWPYQIYDKEAMQGDWIAIGETSWTQDDENRVMMYANGKLEPLSKRQVHINFPERMLHYRCVSKLISLYGDGIFGSPVYFSGEISQGQPVIIEQSKDVIKKLVDKYGNDAVLDAMQSCDSDIDAMVEYLKEVE